MKTNLRLYSMLALAGIAVSCNNSQHTEATDRADVVSQHIDSAVAPGNDFFTHANGRWFNENAIPESESSNGIWKTIQDTVNAQIRIVCESASASTNEKGSNKQKIGDFFSSGMDSATINSVGLNALKPEFDMIDKVNDVHSLMEVAARIHQIAGAPFMGFYVGQDDRLSDKHAVFLAQGGLGLPDRDFYFDQDERAKMIRSKYVEHLQHTFVLLGSNDAEAKKTAQAMMDVETSLAKVSRKIEDTRDPEKNYNKMSFASLCKAYPDIDFPVFFTKSGIATLDTVIVGQPEFFASLNGIVKKTPVALWKSYLKYHTLRGLNGFLDDKTYMEFFNFYAQTMRGIKAPRPRWKRVVEETNGQLGELLGQVYVDEYLPKGTKEKLTEIGMAIKDVYAERIKNLDWMSSATKEKALHKLNTMIFKVGYPDKWKDMSKLSVEKEAYVRNVIRANEWQSNYMTEKYGKPVDRTEWSMYPQTYNAYYNPSNNEIVVPGCNIIVPGYERVMADDAILYSIIGGSTFGHEITHGFDDQGSKYDEKGNLNNWWTPEDSAKFYSKTGLIVKQYDEYVVVDSLHINGSATQGENIADLGGVMMGLEAFKKTSQYKEGKKIGGMTPDQRYFYGYALAWMVNMRPESLAERVKTDVHSPAKFRVNGPLSNMTEFYAAFGIKEGDAMWRPDSVRVKIW